MSDKDIHNADEAAPESNPPCDAEQTHAADTQSVEESKPRCARPWLTVVVALLVVFALSFVPWSELTGRFFKDYDLLADIRHSTHTTEPAGEEIIDPDLLAAMSDAEETALPDADAADSVRAVPDAVASVDADGNVIIEDYTPAGMGPKNLRRALSQGGTARIAIIGDSYIEGDIFSQDIRQLLQDTYGGRGVGYMAPVTDKAGFRQSVAQSGGNGWKGHDMRKSGKTPYRTLQGEYYTTDTSPASTYKGVSRLRHADAWGNTMMMFIAPADGTIAITTDSGTTTFDIKASDDVQAVSVDESTTKTTIKTDVPGIVNLGVWLTDNTGISVDCMSLRGNSGLSHKSLNNDLATQMRRWVDYDMIIVEYGINALSSQQSDYTFYANAMVEVVNSLREAYPNADILVMGIGDRGQKQGSDVHSIATAQAMVDAQRGVARRTGSLFWDTRRAMGGDDAIVDWRSRGLVNADYIHLNHKGGGALARLFTDALKQSIDK